MKQLHCAIIFAVFFSILSCSKTEELKKTAPVDFYLVVDTSGSMADGTMKLVKEHLPDLLNSVKIGDRVHLIQFDEVTQSVLDLTISSDSDKQKIEDTIQSLKPIGPYTDLAGLITSLKTSIKTTENKNFIIVLSDGMDDPRPTDLGKKKRGIVQLNEYEAAEKLPVQAAFIYYIQLGGQIKPESEADLRTDIKDLSDDVTVIQPTIDQEGRTDIGITDIQKSIDTRRTDDPFWVNWWQKGKEWAMTVPLWGWALGLAILLLCIGFIFWLFKSNAKPLEGFLLFYEKADHPSMAKEIKLSKFRRNNLTIGNEPGSIVRIQDKAFPSQLKLKAKRSKNDFQFTASSADLKRIEFMVQKKRGYISSGDTFKINNYTFEYNHGNKQ